MPLDLESDLCFKRACWGGTPFFSPTMSSRIRELPSDDRPREKLSLRGANALSDSELLAILLRTGTQGCNAIELARQLITHYGSFQRLARCSITELAAHKGIGPAKAVQLVAAFSLGQRLARERVRAQKMETPQDVYHLLGAEMSSLQRESLRILLLNTRHHLLAIEEISLGSLNESIAHPREILRSAILHAAHGFILVHNHPSGDPQPSPADFEITSRLLEASHILKIRFFDHVIIGAPQTVDPPYYSFAHEGHL